MGKTTETDSATDGEAQPGPTLAADKNGNGLLVSLEDYLNMSVILCTGKPFLKAPPSTIIFFSGFVF